MECPHDRLNNESPLCSSHFVDSPSYSFLDNLDKSCLYLSSYISDNEKGYKMKAGNSEKVVDYGNRLHYKAILIKMLESSKAYNVQIF